MSLNLGNHNQTSDDGVFNHFGMTSAQVISLTVVGSSITVIGTISNILVIVAVLLNRHLRETGTAILLANLSCFDLIICAVYEPMYVYDINYGSSTLLKFMRHRVGFFLFLGSLNSILAVSLDRFISICFPYHYVEWVTGKFTCIIIFWTWFVAMVLTVISIPVYPPLFSFFYIAAVILLIISFHIAMFWISRREMTRIARMYPSECQTFPSCNKSAVAVVMVIATMLACWSPIVILPAIVSHSSPSFLRLIKITLAFTSLSSAINPFIFCWRLTDFRNALFSRLRRAKAVIQPSSGGH